MEQQEATDELLDVRKDAEMKLLQSEVTIMRRSLEDNLERWDTYQTPDYGKEFGRVCQSIRALEQRLSAMGQSRLMASPDDLVAAVRHSCTQKITDQANAIAETATAANDAVKGMSAVVSSARKRQEQSLWVWGAFLAGFVFSMLLLGVVFPFFKQL